MSQDFNRIGQSSDFPPGSMKKIIVSNIDVIVANVAGTIYAMADKCTHRGCSLSEGTIEGNVVTCPCHGGSFNLTTGKVIAPPPKVDAAAFEIRTDESNVLLRKK